MISSVAKIENYIVLSHIHGKDKTKRSLERGKIRLAMVINRIIKIVNIRINNSLPRKMTWYR